MDYLRANNQVSRSVPGQQHAAPQRMKFDTTKITEQDLMMLNYLPDLEEGRIAPIEQYISLYFLLQNFIRLIVKCVI